jgi:ATP-dependent protease Clp ATPase subunit
LTRLLQAAIMMLQKPKRIVFIDEIDKMPVRVTTHLLRDVSGRVQQALLKLLEGTVVKPPGRT